MFCFEGGLLPPAESRQISQRKLNLEKFEIEPAEGMQYLTGIASMYDWYKGFSRTCLGHWPDPDYLLRDLAERVDLSSVRILPQDVRYEDGSKVHPIEYHDELVPSVGVSFLCIEFIMDVLIEPVE